MQTTTIDLRPQVKHYEANGRQKLSNVYFRIEVREYSHYISNLSNQAAREASDEAVAAFDKEVVSVLLADGWTLRREKYGPGDCPELKKGAQYLYCHPHSISGDVLLEDVERLEAMFRNLTTCKYRWTDNYGDVIVTTSEEDERQLYHEHYPEGLAAMLQGLLTTPRKNLYKDKASVEHSVINRIVIQNRRIDLDDIGTGSPHMRKPLCEFVASEYNRLLQLGYIREAKGADDRTLARWANRAEQREIEKRMKH